MFRHIKKNLRKQTNNYKNEQKSILYSFLIKKFISHQTFYFPLLVLIYLINFESNGFNAEGLNQHRMWNHRQNSLFLDLFSKKKFHLIERQLPAHTSIFFMDSPKHIF